MGERRREPLTKFPGGGGAERAGGGAGERAGGSRERAAPPPSRPCPDRSAAAAGPECPPGLGTDRGSR